jgi:hypothetical protein
MDTGAALGGTGLFISLVGIIYSAINHKHIRSNCCGKKVEFSIDIDSTEAGESKDPKEKDKKKDKEKEKEPKHSGMYETKILPVPHFDV